MGYPLKTQANLEKTLEDIRLDIHSEYKKLKIVTLDNQFVTEPFRKWGKVYNIILDHVYPMNTRHLVK